MENFENTRDNLSLILLGLMRLRIRNYVYEITQTPNATTCALCGTKILITASSYNFITMNFFCPQHTDLNYRFTVTFSFEILLQMENVSCRDNAAVNVV